MQHDALHIAAHRMGYDESPWFPKWSYSDSMSQMGPLCARPIDSSRHLRSFSPLILQSNGFVLCPCIPQRPVKSSEWEKSPFIWCHHVNLAYIACSKASGIEVQGLLCLVLHYSSQLAMVLWSNTQAHMFWGVMSWLLLSHDAMSQAFPF